MIESIQVESHHNAEASKLLGKSYFKAIEDERRIKLN